MSSHYLAMSAYNGFSNFMNNQPTSAPSTSENSSGCSSPPCFRLGDTQTAPLPENPQQPTGLADEEDLGEDDALDGCFQSNPTDSKARSNYHPYARNEAKNSGGQGSKLKATTAERRATHNAIERARRESLNGRFLELARALPTMQSVKRPSKSVIVNKSLEWICESQVREYELARENAFLRNQINELRAQLQMEPLPPTRLLMPQTQQVSYGLAGVHPTGATTGLETTRNFSSSGPYSLPSQQPLMTQRSNSISSKYQTLPGSNPAEGQSSPPTQSAMSRQPAAGPFSVRQPSMAQGYLSPRSMYESNEGVERTLEESKKALSSQSFGSIQAAVDEKVSTSVYLPGLSLHADSGSPFQSLSEPEGPLSTASSSPNRLRYFSSSGSSDGSDKSASGVDYPSAATGPFGGPRKSLVRASVDQLNPGGGGGGGGGGQVEMNGGNNPIVSTEVPLPIEPFEAAHHHPSSVQQSSSPSSALAGFVQSVYNPDPSSTSGLAHHHQDLFGSAQSTLSSLPRHGLMNGSNLLPPGQAAPFPQLGSNDLSSGSTNGFPIGAPWVWG
ncbi:hypothetical protein PGT21_022414 [Puccinia graminis f. sp. tritici]|uniref:BHLH domain-containing protein n=1 Tax=Puccinia graminis f. sp. tritici TaxID=56615 RepID=A0A5B0PYL7_PUCGR|nr:hypothetical protein PGT21_022414 [Puccinia graminis f. sp. tritici]KAA1131661.1 hypothetical protein PGTUg99_034935 [Puccinia graminis f. sp. tritici]